MRVLVDPAEVVPVLVECAGFVPALTYAWVVLPFVEKPEVFWVPVVEVDHGEEFVEVRDVPAVDYGTARWFRWADRVGCVNGSSGE